MPSLTARLGSSRRDYAEIVFTRRSLYADISDVAAADGSGRRTLVNESVDVEGEQVPLDEAGPAYSPDGTLIAYSASVEPDLPRIEADPPFPHPGSPYDRELRVAAADGTGMTDLVEESGHQPGDVDVDPVWSPDGTQIAFTRYEFEITQTSVYNPPRTWVMDLDGSPAPHPATLDPGECEEVLDPRPSVVAGGPLAGRVPSEPGRRLCGGFESLAGRAPHRRGEQPGRALASGPDRHDRRDRVDLRQLLR